MLTSPENTVPTTQKWKEKKKKNQKIFLHRKKLGKLCISAKKIKDIFEAYIRHKRL